MCGRGQSASGVGSVDLSVNWKESSVLGSSYGVADNEILGVLGLYNIKTLLLASEFTREL
jgi:hypothetical protein